MKKKLPIGISDFRELMDGHYYYVDKSLLIKEISESGSKTLLFPRPRRFGKTLHLSMLRYFYEKTHEDTSYLFRNLAIWQQEDHLIEEQGKYPVIYLTFKDVKSLDWEACFTKLKMVIGEEYRRHQEVAIPHLAPDEQEKFQAIIEGTADLPAYEDSLNRLSIFLERCYDQKTVILIDEYDTPIQQGYLHDFYELIAAFSRNLLSGAFKDNTSLAKGVLTGILRVAKESIFSGLNNILVCSLLMPEYSAHFGLTEDEVADLLQDYEVGMPLQEVKDWYNGYEFGQTTIYNPWSIINFAHSWRNGLQPYWVNTSSNELIQQILTESNGEVKKELESLIRGESIRKEINDNIIFREIGSNSHALWSFLLFSGYLKVVSQERGKRLYGYLKIPNKEVEYLYEDIILKWFETSIHDDNHELMLRALVHGDLITFEDIFRDFVLKTFSMFDVGGDAPEKVYHAFVLGMLVRLQQEYEVKSNRESGYGRYDVMLIPRQSARSHKGVIMEFKKARHQENLDDVVQAALQQIEDKQYASELEERGVQEIIKLAIVFSGKEVRIGQRR